uniref:2-dehydropantoate 2-reductase n=1 Tax=Hanusia phi TaxID=3032 RepID=A0A7S0HVU6_9CRYP
MVKVAFKMARGRIVELVLLIVIDLWTVNSFQLHNPLTRLGLDASKFRPNAARKQASSSIVMKHPAKVAVIGSGAVGLYYGGRLLEAGHDVTFLARRDLERLKKNGLRIKSVDGDIKFDRVKAVGDVSQIGEVDWILLSVKSYALEACKDLVKGCMGPNTRVLAVINGFGIESCLGSDFPHEKIFGGMAFTCINRESDGEVNHLKYGAITFGHYKDDKEELAKVVELFEGSKVQITTSECLLFSRWEKLCWNIPFNGIAVAMGGITTDIIVQDPDLRLLARNVMEDVVKVGNEDLKASNISPEYRLNEETIAAMFKRTDNMGPYRPSTMIDLVEGKQMEVEYMFGNPLERAKALQMSCGYMETVISMIKGIQRIRNL